MGSPRQWTAEMNAKRCKTMRAHWTAKSREDLHREIAAANGHGDDVLLTSAQVADMLFPAAESARGYKVMRLVEIGDLPLAARADGRGWRWFRLADVLALRQRVQKQAA